MKLNIVCLEWYFVSRISNCMTTTVKYHTFKSAEVFFFYHLNQLSCNTWITLATSQPSIMIIRHFFIPRRPEKTREDPKRPEKTRKDPKRPEKTRKDAFIYTEKTRKDALIYTAKTRKDPRRPEKTRKDPKRPEKTPEKTQKDPKRHFYC